MSEYKNDILYSEIRSLEIEHLYKQRFKNFKRVPRDHILQTMGHIDLFCISPDHTTVLIEEKFIRKKYDNIYIETVSCTKTGRPGWIYHEYLFNEAIQLWWVWPDNTGVVIDLRKLQKWWSIQSPSKFPLHINDTINQSQGHLVPLSNIKHCIIEVLK